MTFVLVRPAVHSTTEPAGPLVPLKVRLLLSAVLLGEGAWLLWQTLRRMPLDMYIYAWGARAVDHDALLYQVRAFKHWFTYPPFAALVFKPISAVSPLAERLMWAAVSLAALVFVCRVSLRLAAYAGSRWAVAAAVAAGVVLEPVRHTFLLGQVNLILLALVLWDIHRVARGRWAGLGIGIAAAIKLTPGFFIVVLFLSRQRRAAAVAAGTFLACGAVGALVAPHASTRYWLHLFHDTTRVPASNLSNQSPFGALARLLDGVGHVGGWYVAIPTFFAIVGLAVAATFARRDDWLAASVAAGVTTLVVSPVSWTHHWVWVVPALILLATSGRAPRAFAGLGYLLFVAAPLWWTPHHGGPAEYGFHGWLSLVANGYLVAGATFLAYLTWQARPAWAAWGQPGSVAESSSTAVAT
jgi:alpha-1,2-mannosyltransferase